MYSIVVPVYNEEENVTELLTEINEVMHGRYPLEIVMVDDGSQDSTVAQIKLFQNDHPQVRVVEHMQNYGQSSAIITGVYAAQYPIIVTLDGDGQNDPHDIPKLIQAMSQHGEQTLIAGLRSKRQDSWNKKISSKIANTLRRKLLNDQCRDTGCGLKLFHRSFFMKLPHFNHIHRFLPALFIRSNGNVISVPVNHRPRLRGQSKYGVMNRLFVGIVDILGVIWLRKRPCHAEIKS